jgi:hypothetical protein
MYISVRKLYLCVPPLNFRYGQQQNNMIDCDVSTSVVLGSKQRYVTCYFKALHGKSLILQYRVCMLSFKLSIKTVKNFITSLVYTITS